MEQRFFALVNTIDQIAGNGAISIVGKAFFAARHFQHFAVICDIPIPPEIMVGKGLVIGPALQFRCFGQNPD